jgi:hypothetical protein
MPVAQAGATGDATDTDLYVIPVRQPTATERAALVADQQKRGLPMPVPWAQARDFDVEVEWTLKNVDAKPTTATLSMNGGNEYGDYLPELYVDLTVPPEDRAVPPSLMGGTPVTLEVNQIMSGVFREDQVAESAIDLEAIVRYPPPGGGVSTPFQVITHLSSISPVGLEGVPPNDVTPAMVRFQINLSADGQVALDYDVRVRDHNGKLAKVGAPNLYVSPAPSRPPLAPPTPAVTP